MDRTIFSKIEHTVGSLKFAVGVIIIFTLSMIVGTFLESYYGANFAGKVIYKSLWFMGVQLLIFLSIFVALLVRLPPVKRLYGFYIVHIGLIMVGCGSFVTYYAGIDGSITLTKNSAARDVVLPDMMVTIQHGQKKATLTLPTGAFTTSINKEFEGVTINKFIPFASLGLDWQKVSTDRNDLSSSSYLLFNDKFSQEVTFTTYSEQEDLPSSIQLGPLGVHYLASSLKDCFLKDNAERLLLWNSQEQSCANLSEVKNITKGKTKKGNLTLTIKYKDREYNFFPDFTPWPISSNFQIDTSSPIRIFNKSQFEKGPNLFLFGESIAYYFENKWSYKNFEPGTPIIDLPWMGFKLKLLKHTTDEAPLYAPYYHKPLQKDGEMIEGKLQTLTFTVNGKEYWVSSDRPFSMQTEKGPLTVALHNKVIPLPFEFVLTKFKMETDPGTNRPASFESFVQLFTESGPQNHHIYMNNPLKTHGFTFYQSSYFQEESGEFGSVLSVNVDPGRWLKYLGSLLLVLGATFHYMLRIKKSNLGEIK